VDTGALAAAADDVIGTFGGGDDEGSAVEGEIKHAVFYFNKRTGRCQWALPDAVKLQQAEAARALLSRPDGEAWKPRLTEYFGVLFDRTDRIASAKERLATARAEARAIRLKELEWQKQQKLIDAVTEELLADEFLTGLPEPEEESAGGGGKRGGGTGWLSSRGFTDMLRHSLLWAPLGDESGFRHLDGDERRNVAAQKAKAGLSEMQAGASPDERAQQAAQAAREAGDPSGRLRALRERRQRRCRRVRRLRQLMAASAEETAKSNPKQFPINWELPLALAWSHVNNLLAKHLSEVMQPTFEEDDAPFALADLKARRVRNRARTKAREKKAKARLRPEELGDEYDSEVEMEDLPEDASRMLLHEQADAREAVVQGGAHDGYGWVELPCDRDFGGEADPGAKFWYNMMTGAANPPGRMRPQQKAKKALTGAMTKFHSHVKDKGPDANHHASLAVWLRRHFDSVDDPDSDAESVASGGEEDELSRSELRERVMDLSGVLGLQGKEVAELCEEAFERDGERGSAGDAAAQVSKQKRAAGLQARQMEDEAGGLRARALGGAALQQWEESMAAQQVEDARLLAEERASQVIHWATFAEHAASELQGIYAPQSESFGHDWCELNAEDRTPFWYNKRTAVAVWRRPKPPGLANYMRRMLREGQPPDGSAEAHAAVFAQEVGQYTSATALLTALLLGGAVRARAGAGALGRGRVPPVRRGAGAGAAHSGGGGGHQARYAAEAHLGRPARRAGGGERARPFPPAAARRRGLPGGGGSDDAGQAEADGQAEAAGAGGGEGGEGAGRQGRARERARAGQSQPAGQGEAGQGGQGGWPAGVGGQGGAQGAGPRAAQAQEEAADAVRPAREYGRGVHADRHAARGAGGGGPAPRRAGGCQEARRANEDGRRAGRFLRGGGGAARRRGGGRQGGALRPPQGGPRRRPHARGEEGGRQGGRRREASAATRAGAGGRRGRGGGRRGRGRPPQADAAAVDLRHALRLGAQCAVPGADGV
jgi:hypothetical protein